MNVRRPNNRGDEMRVVSAVLPASGRLHPVNLAQSRRRDPNLTKDQVLLTQKVLRITRAVLADCRLEVRFPGFEDNDGVCTKRTEWSGLMKTEQKQKHCRIRTCRN